MLRVVTPPIIRSAYNCIYSIWYLSHRYCYLPLRWKSWNRYECAVGGVRHPQHTQTVDVEQLPDTNKLCNVASCWIYEYIGILLGVHYILHISKIRVNSSSVGQEILYVLWKQKSNSQEPATFLAPHETSPRPSYPIAYINILILSSCIPLCCSQTLRFSYTSRLHYMYYE